jgi:hypothetical protein
MRLELRLGALSQLTRPLCVRQNPLMPRISLSALSLR